MLLFSKDRGGNGTKQKITNAIKKINACFLVKKIRHTNQIFHIVDSEGGPRHYHAKSLAISDVQGITESVFPDKVNCKFVSLNFANNVVVTVIFWKKHTKMRTRKIITTKNNWRYFSDHGALQNTRNATNYNIHTHTQHKPYCFCLFQHCENVLRNSQLFPAQQTAVTFI